jgi:hypothetical protein
MIRGLRISLLSLAVLAVFLFSLGKMSFLYDIFKFSLSKEKKIQEAYKIWSHYDPKNKKLSSLLEPYKSRDDFLFMLAADILKEYYEEEFIEEKFRDYLPIIQEKFPENIFLKQLGLSSAENNPKFSENFDPLFLHILKSPEFNMQSYNMIMNAVQDGLLSNQGLFYLIDFLNWQQNVFLAAKLMQWGIDEGRLTERQYRILRRDLSLRDDPKKNKGKKIEINHEEIKREIEDIFQNDEMNIDLGKNLISGENLEDRDFPEKYWAFSDMSDREPFSKGSFYGDIDEYENNCLRIMGFFKEKTEKKRPSRAGFRYRKNIPLEWKFYLFYFKYKIQEGTEIASFWLSNVLKKEPRLESNPMKWKECFYLFNNSQMKMAEVKPLLRMWGTGSVWFDNISLFELNIEGRFVEKDLLIIR